MAEALPQVLEAHCAGHTATLKLSIAPDLPVFEGHFDEHPIVPGIAEVDWALKLARTRLPVTGAFCGMAKLKFMRVIQPQAMLTLTLDWQPGTLHFEYRDARGACSEGELLFEQAV